MKYYDFIEKQPTISKLVVIEGIERLFADRALAIIEERLLAPAERDLNVDRFTATELDSFGNIEAALAAMPFLASTRVIVVRGAHELRAQGRRDLLAVTQTVPEGNVLVIEDLVSPNSKRPEPLGKQLGRTALRIDTTPTADARERFVRETLTQLGTKAEPAVVATLVQSDTDLMAVRTDLEKLALLGATITLEDLLRESLVTDDAKAYQYASALLEGRTADALSIAYDMLGNDPRGAAIPLIAALATEYNLVWELARNGGELPPRHRWRERMLRPAAKRLGERRARLGYERAVRGFEAIVTGRAEDPRAVVVMLTAAAGLTA